MKGFTLIELLVVMAILGLAYTLVPPLIASGTTGAELKAATRQMAAGLRKARSEAITRGKDVNLSLDTAQQSFQISGDPRVYRFSHAIDVTLQTAQSELYAGHSGGIRFFRDGSSTGGRITLTSHQNRYQIDVDWMSGRVIVAE